ncbi:MAG: glycosyltransferase [Fulvivirga sp.]|uniref:glycosyltransferase n=1 Tax=Fulvivirga sp. TaxID=1931237 RepID=UPI0032EC1008
MKEKVNLLWLSWHPTHYNDYLFDAVEQSNEFNLRVFYLAGQLSSHPWSEKGNYKYQYTRMKGSGLLKYYRSVLFSQGIFLIAGWNNYHHIFSIFLLSILKRKFIIWTDTPQVDIKRTFFKRIFRKALLGIIFKNAKYLFTTGKIGIKNFKKNGAPKSKLINFPFATDTNFFTKGGSIHKHIFVTSGRLDISNKRQDLSIQSIRKLKELGFDVQLKIAGEGRDKQLLMDLVKQLDLQDCVEFSGWLQLDELAKFYHKSRYFLHTAAYDPFPNAVLEALSCGLPVVGSDTSGSVVDRVVPGKNGYIFKTNDLDDLVEKMTLIIQNKNYEKLVENARESAISNNVEKNIKTLLAIKNELY